MLCCLLGQQYFVNCIKCNDSSEFLLLMLAPVGNHCHKELHARQDCMTTLLCCWGLLRQRKIEQTRRKENIPRGQGCREMLPVIRTPFNKKSPLFEVKLTTFFTFFLQSLTKQFSHIPSFAWKPYYMKPLWQQPEMALKTGVLTISTLKKCHSVAKSEIWPVHLPPHPWAWHLKS